MRTRRQIIMAGGTAVTVLATGCLEEIPEEEEDGETGNGEEGEDERDGNETDTNGEGNGETDTEDGEEGEDGEDEPEPASFEVTSVEAPDTVEVGRSFDWSLTVRNDGGEDGVFETSVTLRRTGESSEEHDSFSVEVPAGEEVSRSFSSSHDFLGEYVYRLKETGDEFEVRAVEQSLTLGETYVNPGGVRLTVDTQRIDSDMELTRSYSYATEEGRVPHKAGSDKRFAVVTVSAEKPTREPRELPTADEFVMVVNDETEYESTERRADDAYTGGRSRISKEGVVIFEIDDRFGRGDDYEVYWTRVYPEGTAEAVWSTPDDE